MAVEGDGGMLWGGAYEIVVMVGGAFDNTSGLGSNRACRGSVLGLPLEKAVEGNEKR
jgi:hypothetical protein